MPRRGIVRRLMVVIGLLTVGLVGVSAASAGATGSSGTGRTGNGKTTEYWLHVPAMVVENLCNLDTVVLNGDLYIRQTTRPARNGGYTVSTTINGKNLTGSGLPSNYRYKGEDRERTYQYFAPPPYPNTFYSAHYTKLVPRANAPAMYLVVVLRQVILADGTVLPTIERAYLVCKEPRCSYWDD